VKNNCFQQRNSNTFLAAMDSLAATKTDKTDDSEEHEVVESDFFYGFDDPEFEQVYSLCEQWCTDKKIAGGSYQSDRGENIARAFEAFVRKEHADVAEMVKKDAGIYESAFAEWCANHSESDNEDDNKDEDEDDDESSVSQDTLDDDATPAADTIQSVQTGDVENPNDCSSAQLEVQELPTKVENECEDEENLQSPSKRLKTQ